jgi:Mrp family chromosome partitioning ATPase
LRLRRDVRRPAERLPVLAELTVPDAPEDGPRLSFDGPQIEGVSRIFSGLGIAGEGLVVATAIAGRRPDPRIAVALATTAAVRGASTVIADADLEHRSLAPALRLERSPGLAEYVAGNAEAQDLLQVVDVAGAGLGERARLVCVCAGDRIAMGDEPDDLAQIDHVLERLRHAYDIAIVLGPALDRPAGEWLIERADAVLVEAGPRSLGRRGRGRMAEAASLLQGRRAGLVTVTTE